MDKISGNEKGLNINYKMYRTSVRVLSRVCVVTYLVTGEKS